MITNSAPQVPLPLTPGPSRLGLIPEQSSFLGGRLGRHLHFDERSRDFRVALPKGVKVQTHIWERSLPPWTSGAWAPAQGTRYWG